MASSEPPILCSRCKMSSKGVILQPVGTCNTCEQRDNDKRKCGGPNVILLERLDLKPAPIVCDAHNGAPFLPLMCVECGFGVFFCAMCMSSHSALHPNHMLKAPVRDVVNLRSRLTLSAVAHVSRCTVETEPAGSALPGGAALPLADCARHKAQAAQAALDALHASLEYILVQLESSRDAILLEVQSSYASVASEARAAFEAKRSSLEAEIVKADEALEGALFIGASLTEVYIRDCFSRDLC